MNYYSLFVLWRMPSHFVINTQNCNNFFIGDQWILFQRLVPCDGWQAVVIQKTMNIFSFHHDDKDLEYCEMAYNERTKIQNSPNQNPECMPQEKTHAQ